MPVATPPPRTLRTSRRRRAAWRVLRAVALVAAFSHGWQPRDAAAQPPDVPADVTVRFGPLFYNPGLVLSSGYDTNPWRETGDEAVYNIVETYVTPQIATWMRISHLRVDGFGAVEVVKAGEGVASKNHQFGSNVLWDGPVISPYMQWTSKHTNANPTGFEVGRRSMRNENDLKAGAGVTLGTATRLLAFARRTQTSWDADAIYQTSSLREKLNRTDSAVGGGIDIALTPLTSVRFTGEHTSSAFVYSPVRNGSGSRVGGAISLTGPALINGTIEVGYRQFTSASSAVSFRGLFSNASVTRTFSTESTLALRFERDLQFSFDTSLSYFIGQSIVLTGIQPLGHNFALQGSVGRHTLTYNQVSPATTPTNAVSEYGVVIGRKVRERTWVGVSMESGRASGNQPWTQRRVIGFLTFGSGQFQRLDRPIPFQH
jgi:hypothetical protein